MSDKFEDIRTFITVVKLEGFAVAADRLGLAKSAVSRRIRDLEDRLGVRLIQRTTRRLSLTDAGQNFYDRSLQLLADLDEAEELASAGGGEVSGRIRLTAPVSFTVHCLAPRLGDFLADNPRVRLEVDTDDRMVDIVRNGFDVAIRISNLADSSLMARRITTIRHVCVASPDFLATHGTPEKPQDLIGLRGIAYSNVAASHYWSFASGEVVDVRSPLVFANGDAIREAAIAGAGICQLPSFIVHDAIQRGALQIVLRDYIRPPIAMHAVYSSARNLPARTRVLIDFLVNALGAEPWWDRHIFTPEELARLS